MSLGIGALEYALEDRFGGVRKVAVGMMWAWCCGYHIASGARGRRLWRDLQALLHGHWGDGGNNGDQTGEVLEWRQCPNRRSRRLDL